MNHIIHQPRFPRVAGPIAGLIAGLIAMGVSVAWAGPDPITISGTVTANGSPVGDATVVAHHLTGVGIWGTPLGPVATTNSQGEYQLQFTPASTDPLDIVVEAAGPGLAPQRFGQDPEIPCYFGCESPEGIQTVSAGDSLTPVDFSLVPGAAISGSVTRTAGGTPVAQGFVGVFRQAPDGLATRFSGHFSGQTDGDGNYQTPLGLPPGEYAAVASSPAHNLVVTAWPNQSCELFTCTTQGQLPQQWITLAGDDQVGGINIAMPPGAKLSVDLQPDNVDRIIGVWAATAVPTLAWFMLNTGESVVELNGLAGGQYFVQVGGESGFEQPLVRMLQDGSTCPWAHCDRNLSAPIILSPGETKALSYTLAEGATLEVTLTDAVTGDAPPLAGDPATLGSVTNLVVFDQDLNVVGGGQLAEDAGDLKLISVHGIPPVTTSACRWNWQPAA